MKRPPASPNTQTPLLPPHGDLLRQSDFNQCRTCDDEPHDDESYGRSHDEPHHRRSHDGRSSGQGQQGHGERGEGEGKARLRAARCTRRGGRGVALVCVEGGPWGLSTQRRRAQAQLKTEKNYHTNPPPTLILFITYKNLATQGDQTAFSASLTFPLFSLPISLAMAC